MSLLKTVKQLFGFTSTQPGEPLAQRTESIPVTPKPASTGLPPAAQRREKLLRFVVGKLRAYQNEPDTAPIGIRLCLVCATPEEEELNRVALWTNRPGKFQQELNRLLADNYIKLPENWRFEYVFFPDALPDCTYREGVMGLIVLDKSKPDGPPLIARVTTLVGQTEQAEYVLNPTQKNSFCIGRGRISQTASGRIRTNDIVILNDDDPGFDAKKGNSNGAVSRAHASIRYDVQQKRYALLVDPGGLPGSGNKTKVMHPDDTIERADIAGMNYPLQDGDQIELGGAVTLLFEIMPD